MDLQKKRLIELLSGYSIDTPVDVEYVADHLLTNNVIVLPCKVGQTVYFVYETENETMFVDKGKVEGFSFDENGVWFRAIYEHLSSYWHTALSIGDTVFFTKKDAEKALKERES